MALNAVACSAPPPSHAAALSEAPLTKATPPVPVPTPSRVPHAAETAPVQTPAPKTHAFSAPMRRPDAPPHIYAVDVNTTDLSSGDTLWGKVLTSSNVASVEMRVATYGVGLQKTGVGRFSLTYRIGSIPFFVRGTYPMRIIARNTRGDETERTLPLTIH